MIEEVSCRSKFANGEFGISFTISWDPQKYLKVLKCENDQEVINKYHLFKEINEKLFNERREILSKSEDLKTFEKEFLTKWFDYEDKQDFVYEYERLKDKKEDEIIKNQYPEFYIKEKENTSLYCKLCQYIDLKGLKID